MRHSCPARRRRSGLISALDLPLVACTLEPAEHWEEADAAGHRHSAHSLLHRHRRRPDEAYRKVAAFSSGVDASRVRDELDDRNGGLPEPVLALLDVASGRRSGSAASARCRCRDVSVRISPVVLADSQEPRLQWLHPGSVHKPAVRTLPIPCPTTARIGGEPLRDQELLRLGGRPAGRRVGAPGDGQQAGHSLKWRKAYIAGKPSTERVNGYRMTLTPSAARRSE